MLRQRVITALILIPAIIAVIVFLPPQVFFILTTLIALYAAWEWSNLMELKRLSMRSAYLALLLLCFAAALFLPILSILITAFIWWVLAFVLILLYPRLSDWWGNGIIWRGMMGFLVLVPCWAAINLIRNDGQGIYTLLFLLLLICGADTTAYFVGKRWGRHPLAPLVSPGKSKEGVLGALLFTVIITSLASVICQIPFQIWAFGLGLSLLTVIFSIIGDLLESMMKRKANLKDSGQLLPGHGGLLDRIDSITAAAPIFALGALMLGLYVD